MPNRLSFETSPYLLQHADNPVAWWPWCDEAFVEAQQADKPIFLSIGYSACHWCHVMEHESFENPEIATLLNENFISIKVDREERPDIDQIYMQAVVALTGHGGWPLSAFLTPDQKFFFGGTYWPPQPKFGMPSFSHVLERVLDAFRNRRQLIEEQSSQISRMLAEQWSHGSDSEVGDDWNFGQATITKAVIQLQKSYDHDFGGFGAAPKFPHPMDLNLLIRSLDYADVTRGIGSPSISTMLDGTLINMANGGIFDHLGFGFARYSVDARWLVPHFEKMLYDNAQLATVYMEAYNATQNSQYRQVAEKALHYLATEMLDQSGGFHSAEDADSEGEEGRFYVWSKAEIVNALGDGDADLFCSFYGVTDSGNFEGRNILHVSSSVEEFASRNQISVEELCKRLEAARQVLFKIRKQRVHPSKDDKILVSWNALAIDAFAIAARRLGRTDYLQIAKNTARFIREHLVDNDGRLLHTWRFGKAKIRAFLDDYSFFANALVSLYEADFDRTWIEWAADLCDTMIERFAAEDGGFYYTSDDHENLIIRSREMQDTSMPSGYSMAAYALIRLGRLCGRLDWIDRGEKAIRLARRLIDQAPMSAGQLLLAIDLATRENRQFVLLYDETAADAPSLIQRVGGSIRFGDTFLAFAKSELQDPGRFKEIVGGKKIVDGKSTLYVCQNYACQAPVIGSDAIANVLPI
ncbi:MAG TPA: thioredoxin domain-containing protein [Pirellulaceae bacterium]|mgnify:CR=1 FL=1|nr:thioredoxin domain-containing protein [Pirellulaceae bacterium]HMO94083.1 thioredoxin domain-containing protein [Pirellulaceae bacterium]HMP71156.1 thioredoxin domain-containing protein [Pirellulaceae bacterium]